MTRSAKPAIVLLSGGMDSCVCAALAARDYDAAALHISYGQRTEQRERESFLAICQRLNIQKRLPGSATKPCGPSVAPRLLTKILPSPHLTPSARTSPLRTSLFATLISYRSPSVGPRSSARKRFLSVPSNKIVPAILIAVRPITKPSIRSLQQARKMETSRSSLRSSHSARLKLCAWALNWTRHSI